MKLLFKLSLLILTLLLVASCLSKNSEVKRQFKRRLENQSGLKVKEAVIYFFNYEAPAYVGEKIIVSNLESGKAVDIQYNLEHVECFNELSANVSVEFENSFVNKTLVRPIAYIEFRRDTDDWTITIQKDTLLVTSVRK